MDPILRHPQLHQSAVAPPWAAPSCAWRGAQRWSASVRLRFWPRKTRHPVILGGRRLGKTFGEMAKCAMYIYIYRYTYIYIYIYIYIHKWLDREHDGKMIVNHFLCLSLYPLSDPTSNKSKLQGPRGVSHHRGYPIPSAISLGSHRQFCLAFVLWKGAAIHSEAGRRRTQRCRT